ncbi:MAG: hypothetical protein A2104_06610 [Candidatus Melainabacteria bacterium GWF2_32_7]|nr:MAG: hypothetical protein A2104_06610 [Candidatus Melainabacteria bacterium GWF2_32_7]
MDDEIKKVILQDCLKKELNVTIYTDFKIDKNETALKAFNGFIECFLVNDIIILNEFNNPDKSGEKSYIPIKNIVFIQSRKSINNQIGNQKQPPNNQSLGSRLGSK